jgi:hypothetical protein
MFDFGIAGNRKWGRTIQASANIGSSRAASGAGGGMAGLQIGAHYITRIVPVNLLRPSAQKTLKALLLKGFMKI